MSNSERLMGALAPVFGSESLDDLDAEAIDTMIEAIRPFAAPDFTAAMVRQGTVQQTFANVEGLRAAWRDWLEVFERVRFAFEGAEQVGESVVLFVRQVG